MSEVKTRPFDSKLGDRVARKLGDLDNATRDFEEAFEYARYRAIYLGTRQILRKSSGKFTKGLFKVFNTDIPLESK